MANDVAGLRQQMRDHFANSDSIDESEKTLHFSNASACSPGNEGEAAKDHVYQAAEIIWHMVDRAIAVEARLRSLAEGAVQKLQLADNRIQSLETERQMAEARIQEAEEALKSTELRIAGAENQLSVVENQLFEAEQRAKTAEKQASEVQKVLKRIECMEDEMRTHLLVQEREVSIYQRRRHSRPEERGNVRPFAARREASREAQYSVTP